MRHLLIKVDKQAARPTYQVRYVRAHHAADAGHHGARTHARASHQGREQFRRPDVDYGERSRDAELAHVRQNHCDPVQSWSRKAKYLFQIVYVSFEILIPKDQFILSDHCGKKCKAYIASTAGIMLINVKHVKVLLEIFRYV